jgi:hypothetical protein
MKITHLKHNEIDKGKWDNIISNSYNHMFYAYSWYLDIVSPDWEALIADNYEYLMPLPVKKKYFINYVVQPILTQQLGIFSSEEIDKEIIKQFIHKIPYLSYELNLNEANKIEECTTLPNLILKLDREFLDIRESYSKNTIRNIEKAKKSTLNIIENITTNRFIEFIVASTQLYDNNISTIKQLILLGLSKNIFQLLGVTDNKDELICVLCVAKTKNRITYLLPASNALGKSNSAMFLLIDYLIQQNSPSNLTLDFEGSKIEGIARFYKGFGATLKPYYMIKRYRPNHTIISNLLQK